MIKSGYKIVQIVDRSMERREAMKLEVKGKMVIDESWSNIQLCILEISYLPFRICTVVFIYLYLKICKCYYPFRNKYKNCFLSTTIKKADSMAFSS